MFIQEEPLPGLFSIFQTKDNIIMFSKQISLYQTKYIPSEWENISFCGWLFNNFHDLPKMIVLMIFAISTFSDFCIYLYYCSFANTVSLVLKLHIDVIVYLFEVPEG